MRQFHLHRPLSRHTRAVTPADARASAASSSPVADANVQPAEVERKLDEAGALWTTRRIRCYLALQPACGVRG